ncbi:DegT/DnrJ/EryC1/StrS family aminotransferase [Patescibacteria group bacterium]|nr:DegT/DnrJ/EryC1/StrS family aminotransferase [Patescibacteria group bacterium]MBU4162232.1 DegT/DnrJ/EryC1/StrS family aminotransferase [Patescibacteria group bacterium]
MPNIQTIFDKINCSIVDHADIQRVVDILQSGFLSKPDGGPAVVEFQKLMAKLHGNKYAFAVNSGTSALHCAIVALTLQKDDEIIVPALANIADASIVVQGGGKPVFVDINLTDFNINPAKIEEKITSKTKAIIVVHMYGQPAKIDEIRHIANKHKLILIEDCAQAAGARYKGKYVGSFGDISCFSLYQTKHIICGEGGVVVTNNEEYAKIITSVANNGIMKHDLDAYDYDHIGFNYQLTDIQAALAIGQLHKLDKNNIKRRENAGKFRALLKDIDIQFQHSSNITEHSYFYLTGLLPQNLSNQRGRFLDIVKSLGAPIKKLYPLALTELTLFRSKINQDCPIAQNITKRIFNLYVNPGLDFEDIALMAKAVKKAYEIIKTSSNDR